MFPPHILATWEEPYIGFLYCYTLNHNIRIVSASYLRSSPSNSSSAVAYDCADILNATTSPSSTEQEVEEQQQDSVSDDDAYENAKLNCMLKAITSR